MTDDIEIVEIQTKFKRNALIIGPIIGAAVGFAGAYLLIQSMQRNNAEFKVSAREGVSVTLIILALLRQIADLPDKRK